MLLQFTTGSVEERHRYDIWVSVLNAGVQPANVLCRFVRYPEDASETVVERRVKIPPQQSADILYASDLKDVHCEVTLKVDSASLIVTIKGETHYPLHLETFLVDDIDAGTENSASLPQTMALFWGYASKGAPF